MHNRIFITAIMAFMAATATLAPSGTAHAMTPEQYFEDGNRLFRDDLYWAALLRYSQAAEGGIDTPLLHYNTGIAHYRAGQHIRAREHFLRAVEDPSLRETARYNLGLNAYALGEVDEALRWFRLTRDQSTNLRLREFAIIAISRIRLEREEPPTDFEVLVEERKAKREFTDLDLTASFGYGHDSNIFRSPEDPYIDLANPNQPVVTPVVQSGEYVPVRLAAKYKINSLPFEGFYGAYRLTGRYYPDELYDNANEYRHQLSFGNEYRRKEGSRERRVQSAFTIAENNEVYYDPDDGTQRSINGVQIDDRMNYLRYGPEMSARQSGEKVGFGIRAKGQLWNYEETDAVEYDHEYFLVSAYGQYKFTSTSLFRITADYYSRRYGDRPSFDLDGQLRVGNPELRYDYVALSMRARQRLGDSMWFGFDVKRTERTDQYVGYNDYTLDGYEFEFHWVPNSRFSLELYGEYELFDYPNAFAFHEPTAGSKTQETATVELYASYRITRHLSIFTDARFHEIVSNDLRIQYDRTEYVLGVRWDQ